MRSNDEAIANNTANYNPDEYSCCNHSEGPDTEEAWRIHSIAMDEKMIAASVERMMAMGGRAAVMKLFDDLITEYRLDRFVGRLGAE